MQIQEQTAPPANALEAIDEALAKVVGHALQKIEHLRDGREVILYPLFGREYLGNVAEQSHFLKYLYDESHQIFLLAATIQSKVNWTFRDVTTRGCYNLNIDPVWLELYQLINFNFRPGIVIKGDGWTLVPSFRGSLLRERYSEAQIAGGPRATTYLTEDEEEQGLALWRRLGIRHAAPLVVLHVREAGYHPTMPDADFRSSSIENYLPAIRWLVQQGVTVVRIGDRSMRPLPAIGPGVIDAPHHPDYAPLLDPYAVSKCGFMIGSSSGPTDLARGFAKPQLTVNGYICDYHPLDSNHMILPRLIVSAEANASLSLSEIYNTCLSRLSKNSDLSVRGLRAQECHPDDILAATREFANIYLTGAATNAHAENPLQIYCCKEQLARKASGALLPEERYCSFFSPTARLATALLERRPSYTDGEPIPVADRRPHPPIGLGL